MMKLSHLYLLCILIQTFCGCVRHDNISVNPYWETDKFWNAPMNASAVDSIIEGRKHIIADNGKPYPINEYEMCIYRRGKPITPYIPLDSLLGTWHGYWHIYDPHTILKINPDSTYSITIEDCGDYDEKGRLSYIFAYEKRGKYYYNQTENRLSFLNYNNPDSLSREAYLKSENPINEVRIIYSLEKDTMWLFDGYSDFKPFFRPWVSQDDMMKVTH